MTTKTETLYRPKTILAKASLETGLDYNFEPVTVHISEDLYRKTLLPSGIYLYEKVTHVLPNEELQKITVDFNTMKVLETSEDYQWVLLKVSILENLILELKEALCAKIGKM